MVKSFGIGGSGTGERNSRGVVTDMGKEERCTNWGVGCAWFFIVFRGFGYFVVNGSQVEQLLVAALFPCRRDFWG